MVDVVGYRQILHHCLPGTGYLQIWVSAEVLEPMYRDAGGYLPVFLPCCPLSQVLHLGENTEFCLMCISALFECIPNFLTSIASAAA
jgi:hypothetical protein